MEERHSAFPRRDRRADSVCEKKGLSALATSTHLSKGDACVALACALLLPAVCRTCRPMPNRATHALPLRNVFSHASDRRGDACVALACALLLPAVCRTCRPMSNRATHALPLRNVFSPASDRRGDACVARAWVRCCASGLSDLPPDAEQGNACVALALRCVGVAGAPSRARPQLLRNCWPRKGTAKRR